MIFSFFDVKKIRVAIIFSKIKKTEIFKNIFHYLCYFQLYFAYQRYKLCFEIIISIKTTTDGVFDTISNTD